MFIAQRADRARRVRRVFLALCLLPALVLAGFAAWRLSPWHRESFRRRAAAILGVDVSVGALRHLRPGAVAIEGLVLGGESQGAVLSLPRAVLEITAREVRLHAEAAEIAPAGASLLSRLARAWLSEPGRFLHDVVVDVGTVVPARVPSAALSGDLSSVPLRIECVASPYGRAIRVHAGAGGEDGFVVQSFVGGAEESSRLEVGGTWSRMLPVGIVAACLGWTALPEYVGPMATVSGAFTATDEGGGWRGSFSGVVDGIDLASCTAGSPLVAEGRVRLDVDRVVVQAGRVAEATVRVAGGRGVVGRGSLDAIAIAFSGRAPAPSTMAPDSRVPYDTLNLRAVIDERGIVIEGPAGGSPIESGGQGLLVMPAGPVPVSRLAWALSPAGVPSVPATSQSAWLLSVLPLPRAATVPPPSAVPKR